MTNIKLFESKQIRTIWNSKDHKWYFAVVDVVEVLTESVNPKDYIKKMRRRDVQLNSNWGTICPPLEMIAKDGKIAGDARVALEKESGKKVVSPENYLPEKKTKKLKEKK